MSLVPLQVTKLHRPTPTLYAVYASLFINGRKSMKLSFSVGVTLTVCKYNSLTLGFLVKTKHKCHNQFLKVYCYTVRTNFYLTRKSESLTRISVLNFLQFIVKRSFFQWDTYLAIPLLLLSALHSWFVLRHVFCAVHVQAFWWRTIWMHIYYTA